MSNTVAELNKLKITEQSLSKSIHALSEHLRHVNQELFDILIENEKTRNAETSKVFEKLNSNRILLNKIKTVLEENTINTLDLKQVKQDMLKLRTDMNKTKQQIESRLDNLQKEERQLFTEINACENRLQEWEKPIKAYKNVKHQAQKNNNHNSATNHVCQEVADFLTFVSKSGGHENGWSSEDHKLFLKIRGRSKNTDQLVKSLHTLLPDISEEEIKKHENWYERYNELLKRQKEAIHKWRNNRNSGSNIKNTVSSPSASCPVIKTPVCNTKDVREKIAQWKIEREENAKQQNKLKVEEEAKLKKLEKYKKMRNDSIKQEILQWKKNKILELEAETAIERAQRMKELRSQTANKLIKEFQKQDNMYINRRREFAKRKSHSAESVAVPKLVAPRDPDRLFKPTKQWLLRTNSSPTKSANDICNIQQIKKLGLPNWRKGLQ